MKLALRLILVLAGALLLLAGASYWMLRQSLPEVQGEIRVGGLGESAEILRDAYGIPHIFARSSTDAYFALGFAHAQDRLWQMEMGRRAASGRLSELLGPSALEADRLFRTLGIKRAAEASLKHFAEPTLRMLEAYSAGVNAFLATDPWLPPEFLILRTTPEPWTPADSVAWTKMMAWDLGGNWRSELLRMHLAGRLPLARIHEFLPPYPGDAPLEIRELRTLYRDMAKEAVRVAEDRGQTSNVLVDSTAESHQRSGSDPDGLGSNNWVVSGNRSANGKPLLANDPHLGLSAPPVWYLAHLSAPGLEVIGATLPGVPGVLLGRSSKIAWGFTNTGPDVQDLYLERLDSAGRYLTPDGPRAFVTHDEVIKVRGEEDVKLRVRVSRHGPVISDALRAVADAAPRGHVISFAWTALAEDDLTLQAVARMGGVEDWKGFVDALRDLHAPQQNVVYADSAGNIGFIAAGRVPVRKPANDLKGLAPAPGWDARYDWAGYVPYDELPRVFNPPGGSLVTANHKIVPPGYKHHITAEWQAPYRARRIEELLAAVERHGPPSFARIQADTVSLGAREVLPRFLAAEPRSDEARRALDLLGKWNADMAADSAAPLVFTAWWREFARALYADELGEAFRRNWTPRAQFVAAVLADRGGQSRWCDDVRTRGTETCAELLARSLDAALADLRQRYGNDMADWRWGEAHAAHHAHRPFTRRRALARFFDIDVPSPGGTYTVNVGRYDFFEEARPFANRHAASYRAIYDLGDPEASLFIQSAGQSGHPLSPHHSAYAEAWARGEYIPMLSSRQRLEKAGVQRLVLAPRK